LSENAAEVPKRVRALGNVSLAMALLQSLCTAVFAISGIRLAIGLGALAAVSGIYAPARGFHQDAIRIPMLILATIGAVVNLAVLFWIWHLRGQESAHWRKREITPRQKRSEGIQLVLAVVTLILVGLETWTHTKIHRPGPPPAVRINSLATPRSNLQSS
jgi:formate hydrogenlyase subunit 3/multisubunit Na+/H+ antiporter MnhD subunit